VTFISREPLEQAQHDIQQQQKAIKQLTDANDRLRRQVRALEGQIDELKKAMVVIVNEVDFHEHDLSDLADGETATLLPRVEQAAERLDELDLRSDESNRRLRELERQFQQLMAEPSAAAPDRITTGEPPWPPPVA
jgi:chromosome segregation ATPase